MRLDCKIVSPDHLTESEILQMYDLMDKHYQGVVLESFRKDLDAKSKVFLFFKNNLIQGFTGLHFKSVIFKEKEMLVAYSGDTVLSKTYRGSLSIPVYWGRYMLKLSETEPHLYWLLTSKGFRTYRYLSVFFHHFIPKPESLNTDLDELRDWIAKVYFGEDYDHKTGILIRSKNTQTIRDITGDKKAIASSKDTFINYFATANPNYHLGHELVCLAHFQAKNIHPFILRVLKSNRNV